MIKRIFLICSIFLFANNLLANDKVELEKKFISTIDSVILTVQNKTFSKEERNSKIVDLLTPMFDFELMAKLSLGKRWKTLSSSDRSKFVTLYVKRMKKSYSSKLDAYSDEKIEITSIKQAKSNRIQIVSNLISKENKLEISYKFWKPKKQKIEKNKWLIYDVVILGISILKTDKAQFREFLQTKTIEDLMSELDKK